MEAKFQRKAFLTLLFSFLFVMSLSLLPATASTSDFSFNLLSPNTSSGSGGVITLTGGGIFVASPTCAVSASGSYKITTSTGVFVDAGTWTAVTTGGCSFTPYGGPSNGFQGGTLTLTITLTSSVTHSSTAETGSTITCLVGSPPTGAVEGVTIGTSFTTPVFGAVLFHKNG